MSQERDRKLLWALIDRLAKTAALSVPPEDLDVAVEETLAASS
jgi:hypothetical protein